MPLIEPGTRAAAFNLKDADGTAHRLSAFKGRPVVLYFYPRDSTPGCTKQACAFRDWVATQNGGDWVATQNSSDARAQSEKHGAVVFGVSPDDAKAHAKFADKQSLNFPLLIDPDQKVAEKYGVWQEKSMYGKTYMGIVRTTYLIDAAGKVARRWDKVKVKGHVDEVIAAVAEL